MTTIAIIDDEPATAIIIRDICAKANLPVTIVGEASRISDGIKLIESTEPDLLLLDIEFPEGTGFDLLEQCSKRSFELIFVTAYHEYAIEAFKHHAFDYVLKPIDAAQAERSIRSAIEKIDSPELSKSGINELLQYMQNDGLSRLCVPIKDGYRFIEEKELVFIKADGGYAKLFLDNGEELLISKKIGWFEERLSNDSFARIHKSHLVNRNHIKEMRRSDGGYVVTSLGSQLTISRNFPWHELLEK